MLSLLKAWNTGHPGGVCTVHANHARAGLQRIEQLIAEVSQTSMRALIAEIANLIVSIEPPTPTLAANSCSRSEQQVMMVARNHSQAPDFTNRSGALAVSDRVVPHCPWSRAAVGSGIELALEYAAQQYTQQRNADMPGNAGRRGHLAYCPSSARPVTTLSSRSGSIPSVKPHGIIAAITQYGDLASGSGPPRRARPLNRGCGQQVDQRRDVR